MNNLNPLLNQHPISVSLQEIHNSQMSTSSHFDPPSSHDDFLDQMLSSVPSSASSFPWADDQAPPPLPPQCHLEEQSAAVLASKLRQQQISSGAAKALMLQQQLMLSRGLAVNGLGSADIGFLNMPHADQDDVVDASCYNSHNLEHDPTIKALFNSFTGSIGQPSNQPQHLLHSQGGLQSQKFGGAAAATGAAEMNQPAASGTGGGGTAGQPKQRVRARRGQATDPHSIAERLRRERIAERMKSLQELVPNANKTDKASMLDEIIDYVKFLQLQVKVLSMSRLGGAGAAAANPLAADMSSEGGRNGNGTQTASSTNNDGGMTVTEHQVAKLMEEDMGSAMQYLQGKGLCLMPISLATAISTATCHTRSQPLSSNNNHPQFNGDAAGPTSPSVSALTVQSATIAGNGGGGEASLKDSTSVSKS